MKRSIGALIILGVCGGALSHTYHLGACPVVEPMPGFEMNQVRIYFSFIDRVFIGLLCFVTIGLVEWSRSSIFS